MSRNKLKRPALAFAVTAAVLAVAGPASAASADLKVDNGPDKRPAPVSIWAPGDGSDFFESGLLGEDDIEDATSIAKISDGTVVF